MIDYEVIGLGGGLNMSKKFLVSVSAAIAALAAGNSSATISANEDDGPPQRPFAGEVDPTKGSNESPQAVQYVKNGEAHTLLMKKADTGQMLAYHSSHASHSSHSSHRSGR